MHLPETFIKLTGLIITFALTAKVDGGIFTGGEGDSSDNEPLCTIDADCCEGTQSEILEWCGSFQGEDRCCVNDNDVVSDQACYPLTDDDDDDRNTICKGSCWGSGACSSISRDVTIDSNSCTGRDACAILPESTVVDSDSCNGDYACFGTGNDSSSVHIHTGSCNGLVACRQIGYDGASSVEILSGSCNGQKSCQNIGYHASSVVIGSDACNDQDACNNVGLHAESVEIISGACNGHEECKYCASGETYDGDDLIIDDGECNNED